MTTDSTKITFTLTEEMQSQLLGCKKEFFADCNNAEMIRKLILAGLESSVKSS